MALLGALNAGISGLRAQQERINVIGDNIANVDTVGFKQSRVNFQTMLSQTVSFGTAPQGFLGGVDPVQVGRGVMAASIDRLFSRGSLEATGLSSDLAIEDRGELASSFFVLKDGRGSPVYTRDGSFTINPQNLLQNPANGYIVQGYQADFSTFTLVQGGDIQNINIPLGNLRIARETNTTSFAGNLNGGGQVANSGTVLQSEALYDALGVEATLSTLLTDLQTDPGSGPVPLGLQIGDVIEINCDKGNGTLPVAKFTIGDPPPSGGTTLGEFLAFLEGRLGINSNSANQTYGAQRYDATSAIPTPVNGTIKSIADGGTYTVTSTGLTNTAVDFGAMGVQAGDFIRFLSGNAAGEIVEIASVASDTLTFTTPLTRMAWTGDTFAINEAAEVSLGGVGAGLDPASGAGQVRISGNAGLMNALNNLEVTANGRRLVAFEELAQAQGESTRTNALVYDSLGAPRTVSFTFVFQSASNAGSTFRYFAESNDNWGISRTVGSGMVRFNTQGQFISSSPDQIEVDLTGTGANPAFIFNPDFSKVTGFSASQNANGVVTNLSDVAMLDQDGFEEGTLIDYSVGGDGVVTGVFSNGQQRTLAQIVLARFANPNGLIDVGGNVFRTGVNSGQPIIGIPGTFGRGVIQSGFLEESNVDLAYQFTELIVGQRAFQANARTITTADQLLQELVNMLR